MKIFDIAVKDLTRSFRSYFALMFMFGVPLLMGGMFYFMFGGGGSGGGGFAVPVTKVAVANLDAGGPGFAAVQAQFPSGTSARSLGDLILTTLQDQQFADLLTVTVVDSAEAARSAVDAQQAGVAIIIPADFSERFSDLSAQAAVELYSDPTLTIGPAVVQSVLAQFMDGLSGAKIAVNVVTKQTGSSDPNVIGSVVQKYTAGASAGPEAWLAVRAPASVKAPANPVTAIVGLIMAGMSIFYAFFTGASSAQSILTEDEAGTLARLFTTPTPFSTVLGGKFLAVGLTVAVQMSVLLLVSSLIFGIHWGSPLPVALVMLGVVAAAAASGIFLMSLLKSARQGGVVMGGVITVTGMLGMVKVFVMGTASASTMETVSLIVPQGWAVRGLILAMDGAGPLSILPTLAVLAAIAAALFTVGVIRFQKRFA